ncbi:TetR/AcrR family transcriptional regulator [Thermomonospora cellulosilytica]|uniref:AcrR family transcriptional regulator n=1 Tax=Thermomonospora cellulosilytica TaxID=1411118 RepID=A0A7W3RAL6_9ACTN|nr:TetR/AcrR family transcriptional regulator [Thermomonospora cellulosilytica]MBA9005430.1 AcrR family transcriptional regulator [Thermomonospora cellulosilytica]
MDDGLTREQVIEVAARLFAGLGYDVTTLEMIADAVGVPPSTIVELAGGKRELYLQVMERLFEAKYAMVQAATEEAGSGRAAVHQIADSYLDFYAAHPDYLALWEHRSVSDAADITDIEDRYMRPLLKLAARRIRDDVPEDIGAFALLGVILWTINGFLGTGILAPRQGMTRADDPETLKYFRTVLHTVIDRLLAPPPTP